MNSSAFALHCSNPELARVHHSGSIDSNTFFLWFVSGNDGFILLKLAEMSRHHRLFLWLGVQRKAEFISKAPKYLRLPQPDLPIADFPFQSARSSCLCASLLTAAPGVWPHIRCHILHS